MPREHERHPQQPRELRPSQAGVRVVAVDDVRQPCASVVLECLVDKHLDVGPERLLLDVPLRPEGDAHNLGVVAERLLDAGVVVADLGVDDLARKQLDLTDVRLGRQLTGEVDDVLHLPPRVGVAAELGVVAPDQTVQADQRDLQSLGPRQGVGESGRGIFQCGGVSCLAHDVCHLFLCRAKSRGTLSGLRKRPDATRCPTRRSGPCRWSWPLGLCRCGKRNRRPAPGSHGEIGRGKCRRGRRPRRHLRPRPNR